MAEISRQVSEARIEIRSDAARFAREETERRAAYAARIAADMTGRAAA